MILLSIVMPVYNVEKFLRRSIESVLQQEVRDFELVIVDDGSTDSSGTICDAYANSNLHISVVHKDNGGVTSARNEALRLIKGKYVAFLDSDDWIEPRMYREIIEFMRYNKADVGIGGYLLDYSKCIKRTFKSNKAMILNSNDALSEMLKRKIFDWSMCDKVYRAEIISNIHINNEIVYTEDLVTNYFIFKKANIVVYKPVFAYHYSQRSGSATKNALSTINQLSTYAFNYIEHNDLFMQNSVRPYFFYAKCRGAISDIKRISSSNQDGLHEYINILQGYIRKHIWQLFFLRIMPIYIKLGAIICLFPSKMRELFFRLLKKYEEKRYINSDKY